MSCSGQTRPHHPHLRRSSTFTDTHEKIQAQESKSIQLSCRNCSRWWWHRRRHRHCRWGLMSLRPFLTFEFNSKIFKVHTCIKMRKKSAELQELGQLAKAVPTAQTPSPLAPQVSLEILTKQKLEQVPCSKTKAGSVQPSFATIVPSLLEL